MTKKTWRNENSDNFGGDSRWGTDDCLGPEERGIAGLVEIKKGGLPISGNKKKQMNGRNCQSVGWGAS